MLDTRARLLIVDDDPTVRTSLSVVLGEIGYGVRTAHDGFSALAELRNEIPEVLLSDLNMPGMSGFELLSVVRRRFPAIQTIAMSGAFSGNEVPSGVAADAFYQKGSSLASLLRILATLPPVSRMPVHHHATPLWIQCNGYDASGAAFGTIQCPDCLRTFPQALGSSTGQIHEAHCVYCQSSIHYAIAEPAGYAPATALDHTRDEVLLNACSAAQSCN
jgi:CheY-like chemotaxis protein